MSDAPATPPPAGDDAPSRGAAGSEARSEERGDAAPRPSPWGTPRPDGGEASEERRGDDGGRGDDDRAQGGERPPRRFDGPPRRFDGPPRRDFGDRPPRRFDGPGGRPPRRFDGPPRGDFGDRPPRRFDGPPRDFGDRPRRDFDGPPRRFDGPPRGDGGNRPPRRFDGPPRRDFDGPPRRFDGPPRDSNSPRGDAGDERPRFRREERPEGGDREGGFAPRRDFGDRPPRREGGPRSPRRFDGPSRRGPGGRPARANAGGGPLREHPDNPLSPGSDLRRRAINVLAKVEGGYPADMALDRLFKHWERADGRDKGLVQEIVLGALRWRARLDAALAPLVDRPLADLDLDTREALRIGLYQLYYLDRVPDHAAIFETVSALDIGPGKLANFALREAQRRGRAVLDIPAETTGRERIALERSAPSWIVDYFADFFGEAEADAILARSTQTPPLTLRVNPTKTTREALLERLRATEPFDAATATSFSPLGISFGSGGGLGAPDGWFFLEEGLASVQDEASQIAGLLMGAKPNERILDYCAAPGGKTALMAEQMGGKSGFVAACDRTDPKRRRVRQLARRLGLDNVHIAETPPDAALWPAHGPLAGGPFDAILVDAPCAGLGTLSRRPDVKWSKSFADVERLAKLQLSLLKLLWSKLRPGGRMVYSTCSLGPIENQKVVGDFLASTADAAILAPTKAEFPWLPTELLTPEGYFQSTGALGDMDGFFAARLVKMAKTF